MRVSVNAPAFLLEHLPPQMHVVIATRDDPNIPLARLRARGQLTELHVADLRFTYPFHAVNARHSHPPMKAAPPRGAMAPSQRTSVRLSR
jgi:hypothetical protein